MPLTLLLVAASRFAGLPRLIRLGLLASSSTAPAPAEPSAQAVGAGASAPTVAGDLAATAAAADLSTFLAALDAVDLTDLLRSAGGLTVFAPPASADPRRSPARTVASCSTSSATGLVFVYALGSAMVSRSAEEPFNARILAGDIQVGRSIVPVVDRVIVPQPMEDRLLSRHAHVEGEVEEPAGSEAQHAARRVLADPLREAEPLGDEAAAALHEFGLRVTGDVVPVTRTGVLMMGDGGRHSRECLAGQQVVRPTFPTWRVRRARLLPWRTSQRRMRLRPRRGRQRRMRPGRRRSWRRRRRHRPQLERRRRWLRGRPGQRAAWLRRRRHWLERRRLRLARVQAMTAARRTPRGRPRLWR